PGLGGRRLRALPGHVRRPSRADRPVGRGDRRLHVEAAAPRPPPQPRSHGAADASPGDRAAQYPLAPPLTTYQPATSSSKEPVMADILFVTWDGGGNVPPAVGIADPLRARGHS